MYEDVYGLSATARGAIAAGIEPLQIVGVLLGMPVVARITVRDPGFLLRFIAIVGIVDGLLIVVLAYAPHVSIAIGVHALLAGSIGTLAPAFYALISLIAPARVRAAAFSTVSVFAIPGIAVFLPAIGAISDALGIQASMVAMVPISVAAGLILASAGRLAAGDIATISEESLARVVLPAAPADGAT